MARWKRPLSDSDKNRFNRLARALFGIESSGGHWDATGPYVGGDRAYGVSQVMGANIPSWTQRYYGRRLTPSEYLNNPDAQVAVTNGVMAEYWKQSANYSSDPDVRVRMVAAGWFAGPGNMRSYDSTTKSDGYITVSQYTSRVLSDYKGLTGLPDSVSSVPAPTEELPPLPVPDALPPLGRGIPNKPLPPPPPANPGQRTPISESERKLINDKVRSMMGNRKVRYTNISKDGENYRVEYEWYDLSQDLWQPVNAVFTRSELQQKPPSPPTSPPPSKEAPKTEDETDLTRNFGPRASDVTPQPNKKHWITTKYYGQNIFFR
jgi:hypothetical protein